MYKWWRPDYLKTTDQHFLCCKISSVENIMTKFFLMPYKLQRTSQCFQHFRLFQTGTKQLWLTTECFPVKLLFLSSSKNNILNGVQIRLLKLPNSQVNLEYLNLLCGHDCNESCCSFTETLQPSIICASELIFSVLTKQQTSLHGSAPSWCLGPAPAQSGWNQLSWHKFGMGGSFIWATCSVATSLLLDSLL